jgi:isopentenyl phosphate kinase
LVKEIIKIGERRFQFSHWLSFFVQKFLRANKIDVTEGMVQKVKEAMEMVNEGIEIKKWERK